MTSVLSLYAEIVPKDFPPLEKYQLIEFHHLKVKFIFSY